MRKVGGFLKNFVTPGKVVLGCVVLLALCYGMLLTEAKAPVEEKAAEQMGTQTASESSVRMGDDCELVQTMGFSRCGHSVTRRIAAPDQLKNSGFEEIKAYYDLWQIEQFLEMQVTMQREISLYCPMHKVLMADEAGQIVLAENKYGDGMALLHTYSGYSLNQFEQENQDALLLGIGFDSQEEAEAWLSAH